MSNLASPRLGVLGGTFDPPHIGHLAMALEVHYKLRLDAVLFVVANDPWQKSQFRKVTPADARLEMVRAAVSGFDELEVSTLEIDRGLQSYTADTLTQLRELHPGARLYLVLGSDAAAGLDTWKRPWDVESLAVTVVADRACRSGGRPPSGWRHIVVDVPSLDVSSADIRARFSDGRPVGALVPSAVTEVVRARGLYGSGR